MTQRTKLTAAWTQIGTGPAILHCAGEVFLTFQDGAPDADTPAHRVTQTTPFAYEAGEKIWAHGRFGGETVTLTALTGGVEITPPATVQTYLVEAPTITPPEGPAGTRFEIYEGRFAGDPSPVITGTLTLDGVDVTGDMTGTSYIAPQLVDDGALVWTSSAGNGGAAVVETASVTVTASAETVSEPDPTPTNLTLADFTRDETIYDTGAARGNTLAAVPLSGTSDAGAVIQYRIVTETGVLVQGWDDLATADINGDWSAYAAAPKSTSWLRPEVRLKANTSVGATTVNRFAAGHIIVLIGQSEEAYMMSAATDTAQLQAMRPTITDPDALRVITNRTGGSYPGTDYATNGMLQITDAEMYHTALGFMSNFFAENAPGERFLLIDAAASGTSYWNLASDDPAAHASEQDNRTWDGSFAGGVDLVRAYGAEPGLLMSTWTAAPATTSDGYRQRLYPLFTGRYAAEQGGADYVLGTDTINNRPYDYLFYDLTGQDRGELDPAATMAYFYGPHRFEMTEENSSKQDTRTSIRNFVDDGLGHMLPFVGPEIISYESGFQVASGTYTTDRSTADAWTDLAHPSKISVDGSPRRAQYTALAALYALGIGPSIAQSQDVPELNRAYWDPAGAYAEFWYEDSTGATPAITTTRLARSEPAIPGTLAGTASSSQTAIASAPLPHRAEVAGFEIDGAAAENVTIVGGRVRVIPNSGTFDGNSRVDFGRGGASGIHTVSGLSDSDVIQADLFDRIWMNMPIVSGLVTGVEGIPLRPMPDQSVIGSTLEAADTFTVSGDTAVFDAATWGATTPITAKFRLRANPASNAEEGLLRIPVGGTELKLSLISGTNLRYGFAPAGLSGDIASPVPYDGIMREYLITADPATGAFGIYVDGVEVVAQASGTTGAFSGSYGPRLLGLGNSANMLTADVESITIWDVLSTDGSDPSETPYKLISGNAAAAQAAAEASPNPFTWYVGGVAQ